MSGEKNLPASQKKIDDARKKGQVAVSKDVRIVFNLAAGYAIFFMLVPGYLEHFNHLLSSIIGKGFSHTQATESAILDEALDLFIWVTAPVVLACAVSGLIMTWAQIGFLFSPEAAMPSFKKLNAVDNFKNLFSKKNFLQLLLSILKISIVAYVVYHVFKGEISDMLLSYRLDIINALELLAHAVKRIIFITLACFLVIAVVDWFLEHKHLMKNLRMSTSDMKDEHKEMYGNPEILQKRKSMHRSLINSTLAERVKKARAVVANPTHISVALSYEPGVHDLPYIQTITTDQEALRVREIAAQHKIPVIVNVKLARMIYADCEEEEYIQQQHLALAAEVFKSVLELEQMMKTNESNNSTTTPEA
ncbi:MAG TPA: EscU/YscU/HrcU family type III secretion system export apparatus switch protein [Limnobacter sp.]|nr:EscU/YscU/HrcU family type III secretion system export apparatus switch protein [Limnobacter sp.]